MNGNTPTYAGLVAGMKKLCCFLVAIVALACGREAVETGGKTQDGLAPPAQQDCQDRNPAEDGEECEGVTVQTCTAETSRCSVCVYQGAPEFCDGIDNNCNGRRDETGNALCDEGLVCAGEAGCLDPADRCTNDDHCAAQAEANFPPRCDGNELVTVSAATCDLDTFECQFQFDREACEFGCGVVQNEATCLEPAPCDVLACDEAAAPADACTEDATGITHFDAGSGQCVEVDGNAECRYDSEIEPCDAPPAARCDANAAVNFPAQGTCVDNGAPACEYEPNEIECEFGCELAAGVARCAEEPDPCEDLACGEDDVPEDTCTDDVTGIVRYDADSGECIVDAGEGQCQYDSVVEACDDPAPPRCGVGQDGSEFVVTDNPVGACVEGPNGPECVYVPNVVMMCPFGCEAGECNPDPCGGVACDAPPADACADNGEGIIRYEEVGICAVEDGEPACSYDSVVEACDDPAPARCGIGDEGEHFIVRDNPVGACVDEGEDGPQCVYVPELVEACDAPPPAFCDDLTVVTYAQAGTCAVGDDGVPTCEYEEIRAAQPCEFGCADGQCQAQCEDDLDCPGDLVCLAGSCGRPACTPDPLPQMGGEDAGDCAPFRRDDLPHDTYGYGCDVPEGEDVGVCRAYEDFDGDERRPTYEQVCLDEIDGDLDGQLDELNRPSVCDGADLLTFANGVCDAQSGMINYPAPARQACQFGCELVNPENLRAGARCRNAAPLCAVDEIEGCLECRVDAHCAGDRLCRNNLCVDPDNGGDGGNGGGNGVLVPQAGRFGILLSFREGTDLLDGFINAHQGCRNAAWQQLEDGRIVVTGTLFPAENIPVGGGCRLNFREADGDWLPRCTGDVARGEACNPEDGGVIFHESFCNLNPGNPAVVPNQAGDGRDVLTCTIECRVDADCAAGETCNANGACEVFEP